MYKHAMKKSWIHMYFDLHLLNQPETFQRKCILFRSLMKDIPTDLELFSHEVRMRLLLCYYGILSQELGSPQSIWSSNIDIM